jgi:hypothetical protein
LTACQNERSDAAEPEWIRFCEFRSCSGQTRNYCFLNIARKAELGCIQWLGYPGLLPQTRGIFGGLGLQPLAGMLAVFAEFEREILKERVKAGIAQARAKGITFGRPKPAAKKTAEIKRLYRKEKLSKSEIARRLGIGRTSVRRLLESG